MLFDLETGDLAYESQREAGGRPRRSNPISRTPILRSRL